MTLASEDKKASQSYFRWGFLPIALGLALISTNRWFSTVDDECAIIDQAARPVAQTVKLFLSGVGVHEHPPLYDILLHSWLMLTKGNMYLLRLPSICFYMLGAWVLGQAAGYMGGRRSQYSLLVLVAVWPFGFHYGRLATWYSFCFFSVSLLTLAYLKFIAQPSRRNLALLFAASLILIYSNYFGWVFLACLALDYALRFRKEWKRRYGEMLVVGGLLALSYLPLIRVLRGEVHANTHVYFGLSALANIFYDVYCLFVSESVAPWFWWFGIPASLAILICILLILWRSPALARFLLLCALAQIVLMTFASIGIPKRMLLVSPWIILPAAVTLGTLPGAFSRRLIILTLAVTTAIGWFGIVSRRFYAAPHWIEPWPTIAERASADVRQDGIAIGNNPSFFFYLTYLLPTTPVAFGNESFSGLLPNSVRTPRVYTPKQWMEANEPVAPELTFVNGPHYGTRDYSTERAESWLDSHCALRRSEKMVHDPAAQMKQSFSGIAQPEWRVETRTYACPKTASTSDASQ